MNEKLVIIPTYNEIENINLIIPAVLELEVDFHVLIVDDDSPDGTADEVKNQNFENEKHFFTPKDDFINLSEAGRDYPTIYEIAVSSENEFNETLEKLHNQIESVPLFVKTIDNKIYTLSDFYSRQLIKKDIMLVYLGNKI